MRKITWEFIQNNSDSILADGLWNLIQRPFESYQDITHKDFGNYLISNEDKPYYIGEAKDVCTRLNQQFKPASSTFYKNYQRYTDKNKSVPILIKDFQIQHIPTKIGRKETEEFGIVNLPTIINSFQIGKRSKVAIEDHNNLWTEVQNNKDSLLRQGEVEVLKNDFCLWFDNKIQPTAGLYLVKDTSNCIIYIGESSNINERFATHSGTTYFSALRRHIGTEILSFDLKEKNGKKKYFTDNEDIAVTTFLKSCKAMFCPTQFGRYELEEYLIQKYKPLLNRKGNKLL